MEDFIKTINESLELLSRPINKNTPYILPPKLVDKAVEQGLIIKKGRKFYMAQSGREVIKEKIVYIKGINYGK